MASIEVSPANVSPQPPALMVSRSDGDHQVVPPRVAQDASGGVTLGPLLAPTIGCDDTDRRRR